MTGKNHIAPDAQNAHAHKQCGQQAAAIGNDADHEVKGIPLLKNPVQFAAQPQPRYHANRRKGEKHRREKEQKALRLTIAGRSCRIEQIALMQRDPALCRAAGCLLISADLDELFSLADRILVMEQGQIVEQATPQTLWHSPRHPYTRRLLAAIPAAAATGSGAVVATNAPIRPLWLVEKETIEQAIASCDGNIPKAAALLEISPSTIYRKKQGWEEASLA